MSQITKRFFKYELLRKCNIRELCSKNGLHYGQPPVLRYIVENDSCTQKEISDYLGVTAASIALSTKRLQKSGLITKQTDQYNLRCNRLSATAKGIETSNRFHEQLRQLDEKTFCGISDEEIEQLNNVLDRIISNACNGKDISFIEMIRRVHEMERE